MKQLINQLQRTACTPRDALGGMGDVTPRLLDASSSASTLGTAARRVLSVGLLYH